MLNLATLTLASAGLASAARRQQLFHRQSLNTTLEDSLPSYMRYLNAASNDTSPVTLRIDTSDTAGRNATSPYLYGLMHEDINHSGDGGIYAEMIANRAFQGSTAFIGPVSGYDGAFVVNEKSENPIFPFGPTTTAWDTIGQGVRMTLDITHPLSDALEVSLQIDIPLNATGEVGIKNFGFWGFDVHPQEYQVSFWALANYPRNPTGIPTTFTTSFRRNDTDEVLVSSELDSVALPYLDFVQLNTTLSPESAAANQNNYFAITMDGEAVAGQTFYFNLVSVFPETFKGYPNGLRPDIASAFDSIQPKFLRFPGGNNLEGYSPQVRWKWWETIGPLKNRPGRPGDWSYYNTNGLGLLEYLEWTEAMNIAPVLAVYAGFSLDIYGQSGVSYPADRMNEILQEALDELEYCTGDVSTKWGALRAEHGRPEPFKIDFVEIGNEDWFSTTYPYRFEAMYKGLKAAHPNITYISTAFNEHPLYNISIPAGDMWDWHGYQEPSWFINHFNQWDNWQEETDNEGVTVLLGEYSVIQIDTPSAIVNYTYPVDIHVFYPRLVSALAEGVYAIGAERNPNTVKMSSYAPSLHNLNFTNWTPDMVQFTAQQSDTVKSTSLWLQWLFGHYRGTHTLPVSGDINPLFWVASIDEDVNAIYLKVVNIGASSIPLTVDLTQSFSSVNGTIIQAPDLNSYNYVNNKTEVVPRPLDLSSAGTGSNGTNGSAGWTWEVPKWSITVLQFDL